MASYLNFLVADHIVLNQKVSRNQCQHELYPILMSGTLHTQRQIRAVLGFAGSFTLDFSDFNLTRQSLACFIFRILKLPQVEINYV